MEHWAKMPSVGFRKYGFLAELHARMSRESRILLFLHHNYQVSLSEKNRDVIGLRDLIHE